MPPGLCEQVLLWASLLNVSKLLLGAASHPPISFKTQVVNNKEGSCLLSETLKVLYNTNFPQFISHPGLQWNSLRQLPKKNPKTPAYLALC